MKQVILVDDDPAIQDAFGLVLRGAGYGVTIYSNGHALLNNAFIAPDLIVMDKQLSGADGIDICRSLKQDPATKGIPIIMMSASPHIQRLAEEAGSDDFLEKPFRLHVLLDLVVKTLGEGQ